MPDHIPDLEITALSDGGRGIGRFEGKAVFVPLTAPGDRVRCEPVRTKPRYIEAKLIEILEPSPSRRKPPCPYFGVCGGCQWQHLPYTEQIHWKNRIFSDHLLRGEVASQTELEDVVCSSNEWRYRNRAQFKCHQGPNGLAVGFFRCGSHYVIDVTDCLLLSPRLQNVLQLLRAELPSVPSPDCVPQVDVASGDDDNVHITLHALPKARKRVRSWLQGFGISHGINCCLQSGRKNTIESLCGDPNVLVSVDRPALQLGYGPGGFAQVNTLQNRKLIENMIDLLDLKEKEHVLDLFCGMGNFSLPLARRAKHVTGVENYGPSIASAQHNAALNNITNVDFQTADAVNFLQDNVFVGKIDLVVLDPPRSGSYQVVKQLLHVRPQKILYISCSPATLTRDLIPLVKGGYKVITSRPYDFFPHTWHIESMTLLEKAV